MILPVLETAGGAVAPRAWGLMAAALGVERVHLITGGLGNQMFQHAFAIALASRDNVRSHVDVSRCTATGPYLGYEMDRVFTMEESPQRLDWARSQILFRLARRLGAVRSDKTDVRFNPAFLEPGIRGYIQGFFPSHRYFSAPAVQARVRRAFAFRQPLPPSAAVHIDRISEGDSVAVHVRRGDYLVGKHALAFMGICTSGYYRAAFELMRRWVPGARFFVFSDDPAWCRDEFTGLSHTVIEGNTGRDSWVDMALMSRCRHAIIANSSFSWWARWIGGYEGARCIGPSRMMNDPAVLSCADDFLPPNFTLIDHEGRIAREGAAP